MNTPIALLQALADRVARLRARDALRTAAAVALGSGTLKEHDAERLRSAWRREASLGEPRPRGVELGTALALLDVGIELVKEPAE